MDIIIFLAVLSVLVIVHEWGHFFTAKSLGVVVEKFSVGFGPKLFSRQHKGTEFLVSAIPLGGYIKMAGDDRHDCKGTVGEFFSHPLGHRALIVLMGPVVNFIFAFICLVAIFAAGFPGVSTHIMAVKENGAAQAAGLLQGDKILAVNSRKIYGQGHLDRLLRAPLQVPLQILVQRGDALIQLPVTPPRNRVENEFGEEEPIFDLGVDYLGNEVGWLAEGAPAHAAGLKEGDKIVDINGTVIHGWSDIQDNIRHSTAETLILTYLRNGEKTTVHVSPRVETFKNKDGKEEEIRMIGVGPTQQIETYRFGMVDSVRNAGSELVNIITLTLKTLGKVVTGSLSAKRAIGGPIRIFSVVSNAAAMGILSLIYVMAVISASLGLFNLFPVPVLDGGHIFLCLIEKLRGRPLPLKWEENLNKAGFTALMVLMAFVIYNDIVEVGLLKKISDWVTQIR
ncbi:MAG TPA: RIP metalloprotease RseP [Candidatus Omnitrophota bacterium]|nr:RIP metalloprotease RseP [Candidatus Omnitrophota bacterium]HQO57325.1 RIP metalloprotease RseP [Candidatus Omnitrophota bacterium]